MPVSARELRARWGRDANVAVRTQVPGGSWFARATVACEREAWPQFGERPLKPILQLKVSELASPVASLSDLEYLVLYADFEVDGSLAESMATSFPELEGSWAVRAYRASDRLVEPVAPPSLEPWEFDGFPIEWIAEQDVPCWEDTDLDRDDYPEELEASHVDSGVKVGGWPSLIQSELSWGMPFGEKHPASPEFVLEIASSIGLMIGDLGTIYIGRGKRGHPGEWQLEWSCY